jgi:hypothetical protein
MHFRVQNTLTQISLELMNQYIVEIVKTSKWLDPNACDFMLINDKTQVYKALERIWINVAASFGVKWQQIENATENETKLYAARIITMLLIKSVLHANLRMTYNDINLLIGIENQDLLEEYYAYSKAKKS